MTGQTADGWYWCRRPGASIHYPNRSALNTDLSLMPSDALAQHASEPGIGGRGNVATAECRPPVERASGRLGPFQEAKKPIATILPAEQTGSCGRLFALRLKVDEQ